MAKHRIVFIGGADTHSPGAHDHRACATLLRKWVDEITNVENIQTELYLDKLPANLEDLNGAVTIVLSWEGWHHHIFNETKPEILKAFSDLMDRGTGLVTLHAATAVSDDVEKEFLAMTGGNKKQNYSTHPMVKNQKLENAAPNHPILSNVSPMTFTKEEFYRKINFDHSAGRIIPILRVLPEKGNPEERIVAWAFVRKDGTHSFSCTGPHFHSSFSNKDFKQLTLNAILWTAQLEIPAGGVKTKKGK
jgi:type 1 glutamine amidotransferase